MSSNTLYSLVTPSEAEILHVTTCVNKTNCCYTQGTVKVLVEGLTQRPFLIGTFTIVWTPS